MDPLSLTYGLTSLVGLGLKAFGTAQSVGIAKEEAAASKQFATAQYGIEQQQEGQRKLAMDIDYRRSTIEAVRQAQVARARGLAAGIHQGGAGFTSGSAYGGALGQISGEEKTNLRGLNQSYQIGNTMFGLNQQLSQARLGYALTEADLGTRKATAQGYSALGGSIMGGAMPFSKTLQDIFKS